MTKRGLERALVAACALAVAACGETSDPAGRPEIKVSAAASLKPAFERYAESFEAARPAYSFAGSDELAAQIRRGARPDVYAAANTRLPGALHRENLSELPVVFARNRLVVAVPEDSKVDSLADLERPGLDIAIGAKAVPVGSYTREVLGRLGHDREQRILDNVRSEEPDVAGIVGKLTQGAVDAGFVYVTDVKAAAEQLEAVEIPAALQPEVEYAAVVLKDAEHPEQAREFIEELLEGPGAEALRAAGFAPPGP